MLLISILILKNDWTIGRMDDKWIIQQRRTNTASSEEKLKNNKVADNILAELIKCNINISSRHLTLLIHHIWRTSAIPVSWKEVLILKFPKNGLKNLNVRTRKEAFLLVRPPYMPNWEINKLDSPPKQEFYWSRQQYKNH